MYSTGKVCGCGGDVEYVEGRGEGEGEKRVGKVDRLKREKDGGRGEQ